MVLLIYLNRLYVKNYNMMAIVFAEKIEWMVRFLFGQAEKADYSDDWRECWLEDDV